MYGQLDIKGKELPEDFLEYFTEEGIRKQNPLRFDEITGLTKVNEWLDRQEKIAYMFMSDEQKAMFRDMERNWQSKVNSSFGVGV